MAAAAAAGVAAPSAPADEPAAAASAASVGIGGAVAAVANMAQQLRARSNAAPGDEELPTAPRPPAVVKFMPGPGACAGTGAHCDTIEKCLRCADKHAGIRECIVVFVWRRRA